LAQLAKAAGVRRFVYMSSCSVYGVASDGDVTEESPVNPQTAYAVCKTLVERDLKELADETFSPVFFRNATAFGASPRQRFDLVVNNLCGLAWTTKTIKMSSDGTPWRPLVHGLDISQAILRALDAPIECIHNQIFNIGDTKQNYRVREIAEIIGEVFTGCNVSFGTNGADNRSYRVSFAKAASQLPGFKCEWDVEKGVRQFHSLFQRIDLTPELFNHRGFTRLKQLEYLIRTQQIDQDFYWTNNF
jgi:nucleoside-diphosphate-sugar epimerase